MPAPECMVEGCGSSAYTVDDLTPDREWASLPGEVIVCNHHRDELAKPETEWVLVRDDGKVYVGDQLRKLDEFILLEAPTELGDQVQIGSSATPTPMTAGICR